MAKIQTIPTGAIIAAFKEKIKLEYYNNTNHERIQSKKMSDKKQFTLMTIHTDDNSH
tara:strand:+ start:360 stop:530 length:171 start_codon:yes stop_codon:yes gene_type:complete